MAHVTLMGAPPPTGVAITVYGPLVPGAGETTAVADVGLLLYTSTEGDLQAVLDSVQFSGTGTAVGRHPKSHMSQRNTPRLTPLEEWQQSVPGMPG